jgi:hypothetical protein
VTPVEIALALEFLSLARVALFAWVVIEGADLVLTHWRRSK